MSFVKSVINAAVINKSLLCVGLDPDIEKIGSKYKNKKKPLLDFLKPIIDQTKNLVCAYKPNSAFFESAGSVTELKEIISYIKKTAPNIPVILDAKRGDIGNTASHYAKFSFEYLNANAVTLNPYMGTDSVEPFLKYTNKGAIILCLTSNSGAFDFQYLKIGKNKLYEVVSDIANKWKEINKNICLVVGATKPKDLLKIRLRHKTMPFLIPGIGTQGGDLKKSVEYGTKGGALCIYNISRAVLYPEKNKTTKECTKEAVDSINSFVDKDYFKNLSKKL